jgi:hypothetical protein
MGFLSFDYLAPRRVPNNPKIARTTPPIIIQTALFVGEPLKNRETSELNESAALIPKMSRMMPATRQAIDRGLFIFQKVGRNWCGWFS